VTAQPNPDKQLEIEVDGGRFQRIPVRTRVLVEGDDLIPFVLEYAVPHAADGDLLIVSEKIVAIAQGRAYPIAEVKARPLAAFLSKHVTKTGYGIGIGMPETMEMAFREAGAPRILFAAAVAAVTKRFGRSGDFYRIAGDRVRGIDGPTAHTIPPYNEQVVLVPLGPRRVAAELKAAFAERGLALEVAIVDANDLGVNILGTTLGRGGDEYVASLIRDNPLGQGRESTPLGLIRASE